MKQATIISIDLAKSIFQILGISAEGKTVFKRRVSRIKLIEFISQHPACTIVMEACYSSHYWARTFEEMGHTVKLIPAQHVTPFVRGNKNDKNDPVEQKIYDLRENKIELFDEGNFYVLYQINDSEKILPDITDEKFKERITEILYQKNKYELNRKILGEIDKRSFSQKNFEDLSSKNSIKKEKLQLKSIDDNNLFTKDSVKLIYSLPQNSFTLVSDENDNIYLVKISDIVDENILKGSEDFGIFEKKGKLLLREQMYSSYDIFLENKYEVKINQKTLERVKNYFK